jgi:hypothetical protein
MYHAKGRVLAVSIALLAMTGCGPLFPGEAFGPPTDYKGEARQRAIATERRLRDELTNTTVYSFEDFRPPSKLFMAANTLNGCEGDGYMGSASGNRTLRMQMFEARRRKWYVDNTPNLSEEIRKCIVLGNIVRGMTQDQVCASRGWPSRVNTTVAASGAMEQWVMEPGIENPRGYLYFVNGRLDSWQEDNVVW